MGQGQRQRMNEASYYHLWDELLGGVGGYTCENFG